MIYVCKLCCLIPEIRCLLQYLLLYTIESQYLLLYTIESQYLLLYTIYYILYTIYY